MSKIKVFKQIKLEYSIVKWQNCKWGRFLKLILYNLDDKVDGIVALPIPQHIDSNKVVEAISYEKDVDGFNSKNIGLLALGRPNVIPVTPLGCLKLLKNETNLSGKNVIIIGRSSIVGRPLALLLTNHNATVTLAHSKQAFKIFM